MIGVFIMSVLATGLPALNLEAHYQTFFTGIIVIGAVLLDMYRNRKARGGPDRDGRRRLPAVDCWRRSPGCGRRRPRAGRSGERAGAPRSCEAQVDAACGRS